METRFKSIYTFITIISFTLALPSIVSAIDGDTAGNILDAFKAKQNKILFQNAPVSEDVMQNIFQKEYKINGIQSLINKISDIQEKYQDKKEVLTERRTTLQEAIALYDKKITETTQTIEENKNMIQQKRVKIQELNIQSHELKKEIAKDKATILKYLTYIYSQGGSIYDNDNSIDTIKMLLLNDGDIDQILSDIFFKGMVTEVGQTYLENYRFSLRKFHILKMLTDDELARLEEAQKNLEYEESMLSSQKSQRENLLAITKGQEELYASYLDSQERAQKSLESSWHNAIGEYNDSIEEAKRSENCTDAISGSSEKCQKIELYFQREKEIRALTLTGSNPLNWPVISSRITTYFRDPTYYERFHSHHDAIDISTPQGSTVRAAQDGYVSYILPPSPGGYSFVVIKHPDNMLTVYGHLSYVSVELFQYISAGESIGKSGGSPGTPGAGPMTTGPHLHFEVYKNKEAVDPLRYLNLKNLDPENLATRYLQKFIADVVSSTDEDDARRNITDTFVIQGNTEIERQKYLLSTYAAPSFQDWNLWMDEALGAGIDPSFLMCVGLSETSLGNHLKTAYNIGNIGNTDDGSVYSFASPKEGVYWMARTFNNRFLGKYTKVSDLSRWGNTEGPIYASSNENWHNNTIRCLSSLKGRFIEDGFVFRLGQSNNQDKNGSD